MCGPSPAVRPFADGVLRRTATAPSDASERASSGKKRPRAGVAPARDSSACLTKMTRNGNSVVTATGMEVSAVGGEMSSQEEVLQKRLASELDALRGILKNAELISRRRGACKGGARTASNKERFLAAPKQRAKPIEDGGVNAPSVKRRKISTLVEQKLQKQKTRMSPEERNPKECRANIPAAWGMQGRRTNRRQKGAVLGGPETASEANRDGGVNAPSVKRRKISTLVEQKPKPKPRMSPEERNQVLGRLSSLSGKVPGQIVEFLKKQFGDADAHGDIAINMDTVQDSVLLELKTLFDKLVADERKHGKVAEENKDDKVADECKDDKVADECKDDKVADESKDDKVAEEIMCTSAEQPSEPASATAKRTVQAESVSGESTGGPAPPTVAVSEVAQSGEAKKVQDVQRAAPKPVNMRALLYRANLRRQLMEMERTKLPDVSIHPRDLQRLGIAEYGHPSIMRQIGLVLKVDA